jgi:pimeloyl-ACP methyl ester carboxylesterase
VREGSATAPVQTGLTIEFAQVPWRARSVRIEYAWIAPERTHAPLMVFLHEGLGSLAMWKDFPQRLCAALGVRGLAYSRPGYGRSTPRGADELWDVDFMHQQAHEVLPALFAALRIDTARDKPWLFGHSDGGSIALLYAVRFTTQIAGAVVLAPHIMVEDVSVASIAQTRQAYLGTNLRKKLARYHDDVDSAFWGWNRIWLHPPFKQWSIEQEIASITCPLLAMQGVDDEYGTLAQIHGIAKQLPHTHVREIAACGHSPHRDQPQAVVDAVKQFVCRHQA